MAPRPASKVEKEGRVGLDVDSFWSAFMDARRRGREESLWQNVDPSF